ncbi:MAG: M12 family metallopeptidase [Rhodospirillales bacterium]
MGFGRLRGSYRWSGGILPFEIDETSFPAPSSVTANALITSARNQWNSNTLLNIRPRNGEADYVVFVGNANACSSATGRQGGRQIISCALAIDAIALSGAGVALCKQTEDVLTALVVATDGRLAVTWVEGTGDWNALFLFGPADFPSGGNVALCKQTDNTLTALAVGNDQRLHVAWVDGTGPWNPAVPFGVANLTPGAHVALCRQTDDVLTAFLVAGTNPAATGQLSAGTEAGRGQGRYAAAGSSRRP